MNLSYTRARRRMCYEAAEGRTFQQRKLDRETIIYAPKEPLSGSSSLAEKTSSKCTEFQQKRLFTQATAVAPFLELCQEFKENRTKVYINDVVEYTGGFLERIHAY